MKRAGFHCEVSLEPLMVLECSSKDGQWTHRWRRAVDHVIPERAARKLFPGCDPHTPANLLCITSSLHARKTKAEWRIYRGDWIGYKAELRALGYDPHLVDGALTAIGLSVKEPR